MLLNYIESGPIRTRASLSINITTNKEIVLWVYGKYFKFWSLECKTNLCAFFRPHIRSQFLDVTPVST